MFSNQGINAVLPTMPFNNLGLFGQYRTRGDIAAHRLARRLQARPDKAFNLSQRVALNLV